MYRRMRINENDIRKWTGKLMKISVLPNKRNQVIECCSYYDLKCTLNIYIYIYIYMMAGLC